MLCRCLSATTHARRALSSALCLVVHCNSPASSPSWYSQQSPLPPLSPFLDGFTGPNIRSLYPFVQGVPHIPLQLLWLAAWAARVLLLMSANTKGDDVFRFVWEGWLQLQVGALPPVSPGITSLTASLYCYEGKSIDTILLIVMALRLITPHCLAPCLRRSRSRPFCVYQQPQPFLLRSPSTFLLTGTEPLSARAGLRRSNRVGVQGTVPLHLRGPLLVQSHQPHLRLPAPRAARYQQPTPPPLSLHSCCNAIPYTATAALPTPPTTAHIMFITST
jgi:hypothetical protein